MQTNARILIAGHTGLAGSALVRALEGRGYQNLLRCSSTELDLTEQAGVRAFFQRERPEYVLMAAGRCGGILANTRAPAEFIYDNIAIQSNVIHAAYEAGVTKLLYLACSCVYPRECPQPINEDQIFAGPMEPTSEPFSIAKQAGIVMCRAYNAQYGTNFISVVPATLYGPNDNFDPESSHFLSGLIVKFHQAARENLPTVALWGSGSPERELLYVDDFADAALFLMHGYRGNEHLNIGTGRGITIREAAEAVKRVSNFQGEIAWDTTRPDGAPRKVLDSTRINALGWQARTRFEDGLRATYAWYLDQVASPAQT